MGQPIVREARKILSPLAGDTVGKALVYIESCFNPSTPSHDISLHGLYRAGFTALREIPEGQQREEFERIIYKTEGALLERGYRENLQTWVEHKLCGSTVFQGYQENPHTPIGILEGDLTVDEANRARALDKCQSAMDNFFGREKGLAGLLVVTLEPLDAEGVTVRDPRIVDRETLELVETVYSSDFPYRRAELDER